MPDRELSFAVHRDDRGTLLPIELADTPFVVRRVFTVVGPAGGAERGGHAAVCQEAVVVVAGSVEVEVAGERVVLDEPGAGVLIGAGEYVAYRLRDAPSVILVLADEDYRP
ncbi:MAG: WxcM-like domain-containing protein [Nocardioides sp.]